MGQEIGDLLLAVPMECFKGSQACHQSLQPLILVKSLKSLGWVWGWGWGGGGDRVGAVSQHRFFLFQKILFI